MNIQYMKLSGLFGYFEFISANSQQKSSKHFITEVLIMQKSRKLNKPLIIAFCGAGILIITAVVLFFVLSAQASACSYNVIVNNSKMDFSADVIVSTAISEDKVLTYTATRDSINNTDSGAVHGYTGYCPKSCYDDITAYIKENSIGDLSEENRSLYTFVKTEDYDLFVFESYADTSKLYVFWGRGGEYQSVGVSITEKPIAISGVQAARDGIYIFTALKSDSGSIKGQNIVKIGLDSTVQQTELDFFDAFGTPSLPISRNGIFCDRGKLYICMNNSLTSQIYVYDFDSKETAKYETDCGIYKMFVSDDEITALCYDLSSGECVVQVRRFDLSFNQKQAVNVNLPQGIETARPMEGGDICYSGGRLFFISEISSTIDGYFTVVDADSGDIEYLAQFVPYSDSTKVYGVRSFTLKVDGKPVYMLSEYADKAA